MVKVKDPMDGKEFDEKEAYSCVDGLYFSSMQNQQMYYKALQTGYQVKVDAAGPRLEPVPGRRVWTLNKPEGFLSRSKGHYEVRSLTPGDYKFIAEAPDLFKHQSRSLTVSLRVVTPYGEVIRDKSEKLASSNFRLEEKFSIMKDQAPCSATLDFISHNTIKRTVVAAHLEMVPIPKLRQDLILARRTSKEIKEPGEYLVEMDKGASGAGMTLTWDTDRQGVVVHRIKEKSSAMRANLSPGDMITAIQGERMRGCTLKQVIKKLRSVPITVVLLMTKAPPDYVAKQTSGAVKTVARKKRNAPAPPTAVRHQRSATVAPAKRQSVRPAPPPPQRPERKSVPVKRAPPPVPVRRSTRVPPPPPQARHSMSVAPPQSAPSPLGNRAQQAARASANRMSGKFESPAAEPPLVPGRGGAPLVPGTAPAAPSLPSRSAAPPPPSRSAAPPPPSRSAAPPPPSRSAAPPPPSRSAAPPPPSRSAAPPPPSRSAAPPPPSRSAAPPPPSGGGASSSQTQEFGMEFAKYTKMRKSGVPEGAIRLAFQRDGLTPPPGFFGEEEAPAPAQGGTRSPPTGFLAEIANGAGQNLHKAPAVEKAAPAAGFLGEIANGARNKLRKAPAVEKAAPAAGFLSEIANGARNNLRKAPAIEKPAPRASNPLLEGLQGFDKSRLRSASTPAKQSDSEKASVAAALAEKGKSGLHSAFASAIEQRRGFIADSDSEEEYNDDDEWEL